MLAKTLTGLPHRLNIANVHIPKTARIQAFPSGVRSHIYTHHTVEPGYNYIGLRGTSSIASDILWLPVISSLLSIHYTPRLEQHSFITIQTVQTP